jgi:hypothetical protein
LNQFLKVKINLKIGGKMKKLSLTFLFISIIGILFAQTSIYDIQYTEDAGDGTYPSPYDGQTVTTTGIVTGIGFNGYNNNFCIQDGSGAWNGVYVYNAATETDVAVGDEVEVAGTIIEFYGYTEFAEGATVTVLSSGNPLPAVTSLTTNELATSEAYEGVLVKISSVSVTAAPNSYGEWYVDDGSGECQIDDGIYQVDPAPVIGDNFIEITGLVDYSYDEYGLHPRSADDVVPDADTNPPQLEDVVAIDAATVEVYFNEPVDQTTAENTANYAITTRDVTIDTATLNPEDDTNVTLAVSGMVVGNYTLTVNGVEDLAGNAAVDISMNFSYTEPVNEGDVVINEVGEPYQMPNIWGDSYIELYNTTENPIDISGWTLWSYNISGKATSSFVFPANTLIQPDGYIIATRVRDQFLADYGDYVDSSIVPIPESTTGTGVYIKYDYYFQLEDAGANIIDLTSETIDWNRQVWEKNNPGDDGTIDENWHLTFQTEPVEGTPGQPNSEQPDPTAYTIYQLQTQEHDSEFISTTGIVTGIYSGYYTLQNGIGAYNGIWVEGDATAFTLGDEVNVIGTIAGVPDDDISLITAADYEIYSSGNTLPEPEILTTGAILDSQWDGILVYTYAQCDSENPDAPEDYGEWSFNDGSGSLRVDDMGYLIEPTLGNYYEVTAPRYYSYGNVKLEPRDADDINEITPIITVTSPNGGEEWMQGTTHTISWTCEYFNGNVNIELITADKNREILAENIENNGSWEWTIADDQTPGTNYLIKISDTTDGEPMDTSDEPFVIVSDVEPYISVISPNGGEEWLVGTTHEIIWESANVGDFVDISLFDIQAGSTVLVEETANDGSWGWAIPTDIETGDIYLIQISDSEDGEPEDFSDNPFSIIPEPNPTITVTSPNGGEEWMQGEIRNITWTSQDFAGNVSIVLEDLSKNREVLVESTENDGLWEWAIPEDEAIGDSYIITVEGVEPGDPYDSSDDVFSIVGYYQLTIDPTTLDFMDYDDVVGLTFTITNDSYNPVTINSMETEGNFDEQATWSVEVPDGFETPYEMTAGEELSFVVAVGLPVRANTDILTDILDISTQIGDFEITLNLNSDLIVANDLGLNPASYSLGNNYPNPFNPITTISYTVKENNTPVTIEIYNVKGELVKSFQEIAHAGVNSVTWEGTNNSGTKVSSGMYLYKMKAGTYTATKKMLLMK